ncbi:MULTISPECIES: hypothetical protein [Mycobacterium ulcerans group]|uniref:Uncharacterized protein n=2 Tax=Mycobacterium ulcerans group TaxID=2993898 RepID=L7V5C9_MYCL1|nr:MULTISPECIES: hypothetical protein [Mycobacterium ulcerans group]RFZ60077.1 hypothetical protein DL240490_04097 [Mycobacterium marinum]AGC61688.1 hypothetical protein MULP_01768 [Mycobacterium liflandii 128FXT]MEB3970933.1 hypothetical protein [Mycobacterium ulcerans]MEB3979191.1 hypothetical protein [Mycobacterium ulcerans]MEB4008455.1 hypothetical protein [Mycobacterium ulcerans]
MLDGTEGKEANGTSPAMGATTVNGTSPLSSAIHSSLITMVRSRMAAISGTASMSPSTMIAPESPFQP